MPSKVQQLADRRLCGPPKWLPNAVDYETLMGSVAYGVSSENSDNDVYGFCIPPRELVFPHLAGNIPGFGRQIKHFDQYQEHHIHDPSGAGGRGQTWDLSIFSIVRFFQLAMENNPNMVDALFTPQTCVLHCTRVGQRVREQRRLFLHKGSWHKFKGYAYQQLHKMQIKQPEQGSKRAALVAEHGYDVKFAYHVVRLLGEVEQILEEGDLDLQRNREQLKSIRRGEWTEEQIREHFARKEKQLEELYHRSTLPTVPDEAALRTLLLECLEEHYGSLSGCVVNPDAAAQALREIQGVLDRYQDSLPSAPASSEPAA